MLYLLAVLFLLLPSTSFAEMVGRAAKIIDGDTFWLCDQAACHKIRVCGIDAPERDDPRHPASKIALQVILEAETVRCVPVGGGTPCDDRSRQTSRDRIVAQCFIGPDDIAAPLVNGGFACDWIKFSGGHYSKNHPARVCHARLAR